VLGTLDTAFTEARELEDVPMGTLRIVARRSFGMLQVAPALPAFRAAYPLIGLDLTLTEELELMPGGGIDIAIRMGAPADKSVVVHQLTSADRRLCASPAYYERAGMPRTPAELAGHDCLTYRRAAEPAIWTFQDGHGQIAMIPVGGSLQSNSGEVLRAAATAGLGLVLLPDWLVRSDLESSALRISLEEYAAYAPPYREAIFAVHRRGDVAAKITVFVAHLREVMGTAVSR
jgi:DNA-binding transcriptional LysR family regulator